MANQQLKTRYLVIRLDINDATNGVFANGSTTKFVYGYSGGVATTSAINSLQLGIGYPKIDCIIQTGINYQANIATVVICGMSENDINTFTRTNLSGFIDIYTTNTVTIYAGYELGSDGLPPLVYSGGVIKAAPDYNSSRDRPLIITSMQYFAIRNINLPPTNLQGIISRDNVLRFICNNAQLHYEGYKVTGNDYNPIFVGDALSQLDQALRKYNLVRYMSQNPQTNLNTVEVAPKNIPFDEVPYILNVKTGEMIGYPQIEDYGFSVRTYFNPNLTIGKAIQVESITVPLINNKNLYINNMVHELHNREESWQSTLQLNIWQGLLG